MRVIVYTQPNGIVAVCRPCISIGETLTEAEAEQRAWDRLPTDAINPEFRDPSTVPTDRYFRNAWKHDLTVDMAKAREIHRGVLRRIRDPLMKALDAEYLQADEKGKPQDKAAVAAKKQALRDVTSDPAIEAAATPEELKTVIPPALK